MRTQLKILTTTLAYVFLMSATFSVKANSVSDWGRWDADINPQVLGAIEPQVTGVIEFDVNDLIAGSGIDSAMTAQVRPVPGEAICYSCGLYGIGDVPHTIVDGSSDRIVDIVFPTE